VRQRPKKETRPALRLAGFTSLFAKGAANMTPQKTPSQRFIGLDIHKHYLVAVGVDADLNQALGPQRVEYIHLEQWMARNLHPNDAVVIEMTTNTWQMYEDLLPHVQSVMVVHPPHVALITRSQVMNDKIAATTLARLLAKGLLVGIWVPPRDVQELRALIAQRSKMTRLATQACRGYFPPRTAGLVAGVGT
jgi:hypothetical protein